jgi:uncharacterized protein (TIGR00255 family)
VNSANLSLSRAIQSMTGYATVTTETAGTTLTAELRSVNSRFLDLSFRLADELRPLEALLRERLSAVIQRGKVECRISLTRAAGADRPAALNDRLLEQVLFNARKIQQQAPEAAPLCVSDLLRWPGVLTEEPVEGSLSTERILPVFDAALLQFQECRQREGEKLMALLLERVIQIEQLIAQLNPKVPELLSNYADKLTERLRGALLEAGAGSTVPVDEIFARVRQEVTLYALKIDVAEEIGRLAAHASEMRRILKVGGPVGKRLDFLMQEFNREANTLGSKGLDLEVSRTAVEFKILIEQMREQIQNLE